MDPSSSSDDFLKWALQTTPQSREYLNWAKVQTNVKVISYPVPDGILPKNCSEGQLHDVRVFSKKRIPDDSLYKASKQLRDKVARGNMLLSLKVKDGKEFHQVVCFLVFAIKKFTGGMGDDDTDEEYSKETYKLFFMDQPETSTKVVSTVKENGAAAHLAVVKIFGQNLIIAGSKNVHLLVRGKEDIASYRDDRFKVARIVASTVLGQLEKLSPENRQGLLNYLSSTHYTACFELIDPEDQHVELIELDEPELRFIAFTTYWMSDSTICLNPLEGFDVMKRYGMKVVGYDVHDIHPDSAQGFDQQLDPVFSSIRQLYQTEGRVVYFLNGKGQVIGLLKKKSAWYIILRALREKIKGYVSEYRGASQGPSRLAIPDERRAQVESKMVKRLKEVQKWLNFNNENLEAWKKLAVAFNTWVCASLNSGSISPEIVANKFPVAWDRFLKETASDDHIVFTGTGA